jgi:hypothetical protein
MYICTPKIKEREKSREAKTTRHIEIHQKESEVRIKIQLP